MPYNPTVNFKLSDGRDLGDLEWITKEYLLSVYPQIANQVITPQLWVWGDNNDGLIGDNTTNDKKTPVTTFAGGSNWKQVASSFNVVSAIKTDGTLWIWGFNTSGEIGNNTTNQSLTPVTTFAGGTNWKQVSCGGDGHTAAIKTDGTLWIWGKNGSGQLGINNTDSKLTPVTTFAGGTNWKQIACGVNHTAAIKTDGTLWTWGLNDEGQLGINNTNNRLTPITTFAGGTNWKQVDCGENFTGAIKTDGTLWMWGRNTYIDFFSNQFFGMLGDNTITDRSTPVTTFAGGTNWKQVACGSLHTAAIKTDGTLWTWGEGNSGQLGNNTFGRSSTPVTTFSGGSTWKQVACGNGHVFAVKVDGTLWGWGSNSSSSGELGIDSSSNKNTPVTTFSGGSTWKQVACGDANTIAIQSIDYI